MSWWGTLEAEFLYDSADAARKWMEGFERGFEERTAPTGSETGPSVRTREATVHVDGRLRDVLDDEDSPAVLAWFVSKARFAESADLMWELDGGPRYRYQWRDGGLTKLRGVLDG